MYRNDGGNRRDLVDRRLTKSSAKFWHEYSSAPLETRAMTSTFSLVLPSVHIDKWLAYAAVMRESRKAEEAQRGGDT